MFPAGSPSWKFPMRQTRALPARPEAKSFKNGCQL
jgi:hypothetical protein